jgi:hypothetical protein
VRIFTHLRRELKLQYETIHLGQTNTHRKILCQRVPQASLSVYHHSFDSVDAQNYAVADTQGSCDFIREVHMPGAVNEVEQVGLAEPTIYQLTT